MSDSDLPMIVPEDDCVEIYELLYEFEDAIHDLSKLKNGIVSARKEATSSSHSVHAVDDYRKRLRDFFETFYETEATLDAQPDGAIMGSSHSEYTGPFTTLYDEMLDGKSDLHIEHDEHRMGIVYDSDGNITVKVPVNMTFKRAVGEGFVDTRAGMDMTLTICPHMLKVTHHAITAYGPK